ncbi:MAG: 16S rRNA (guanine(527)-N(7))-methyltransferase RsmG [Paracoccaceae bacterium]
MDGIETDDIGRQQFTKRMDVSRETMTDFDTYAALLRKWSPKINLVSKNTLPMLWTRHFLDSAQILSHAHITSGHWVDIGSGGGLPGLVLAILAKKKMPDLRFTFVDSDTRKCVFLQTVTRELNLQVNILPHRIDAIEPLSADILSARALAPLTIVLGYAAKHLNGSGRAVLMKGASFQQEVDVALETWAFQSDEHISITDNAAVILNIGDITRV